MKALLEEAAEEAGVDLDELPAAEFEEEEERVRKAMDAHPLMRAARDYTMSVHQWIEASEGLFQAKARKTEALAPLDLPATDPEQEMEDLADAVDVVEWYHTLITAKIGRALDQQIRGVPECIADMPKDSDGSAKVALIAMDRSMAAWLRTRERLPEQADRILDFLVALERLRRSTERQFPEARSFVRPGFDDDPAACESGR
jgi:hypothetical protein